MPSIFGGLPTPQYLGPEQSWASGSQAEALGARNYDEGVRLGQGQQEIDQRQQEIDARKQAVQTAIQQHQQGLAKISYISDQLKDASNPADIFSKVSENPQWMLDPQTAGPVSNYLKQADATAKIQNGSIASKVATEQTTSFNKKLESINSSDPQTVAKIRGMKPNPDGTPSADMWQVLGDSSKSISDKAAADAAARGDSPTTAIGPNGVTTTYRPSQKLQSDKILDEIDKVKADAETARQSGDMSEYNRLTDRANTLKETLPTKGQETMATGFDDQGRPIFSVTRGGKGGDATVGTQSLAQQNLIKYGNATQLLNTLQKNLSAKDVGVAGVGGEMLVDRGLAQLDSRFANKDRIKNREGLTILKESLMKAVTDDSRRFSNQDRDDIAAALPSNGAFESLADAQQKMSTVRGIITDRARNYAERTGTPVPDYAKSKDEIAADFKTKRAAFQRAVQAGSISQADADAAIKKARDEAAGSLNKYF